MRYARRPRRTRFAAKEVIYASKTGFRWDARIGDGLGALAVTDAYDSGHGFLVIKFAGAIPLKKMTGPEFDQGELQRYLASVLFCPPMLLNHPSLQWEAAGPQTLRVRDGNDPTGCTVYIDIGDDGRPVACQADRPRIAGKQIVLTSWSATATELQEYEGLRMASKFEASWLLPEGWFSYIRGELTSVTVLR